MSERPHAIPAVTAAVLLLVALGEHPYGYYTFLRWSVCVAALVVAWVAWSSQTQAATWLFVGVAILFNPIAPVYMARENWNVIDVAASVCFLGSLGLRRNAESRAATKAAGTDAVRSLLLHQAENVLRQASPADFETTQNAASMCVAVVYNLERLDAWRAGYDSLNSFYAAHEAQHPDIRLYGDVWSEMSIEDPNDPPSGTGVEIVERIASARETSFGGVSPLPE